MTRENWDEWDYHRPERWGCFELLAMIALIFLGWFLMLWLDSVWQEAGALKPAAVQETK